MIKNECFKIQLLQFENLQDIFNLNKGRSVLRLRTGKGVFDLNPTVIEADPFLFVKDGKLYLFYESKRLKDKGVIKMISTEDLMTWTSPVTVLEEPFHLSFPWVFEEDGIVYMIPETGAINTIRLYAASSHDLNCFYLVKTLVSAPLNTDMKMGYGDSCICNQNDKYYLFTQLQFSDGINTLELYVSDSLSGEYTKHPCSPIQHNQKLGRNAGSIIDIDGKKWRFSQDCTVRYGDNVHVSEIVSLTPDNYEEKLIKENIIPQDIPFYKEGGHQYNLVEFKGKYIVATDAKEYLYLFLQRLFNRVLAAIV